MAYEAVTPYKVSRKVFDKAMDRQDLRLKRVQEDYRNDVQALFLRIKNLENQLSLCTLEVKDLAAHVLSHCTQLDEDRATGGPT